MAHKVVQSIAFLSAISRFCQDTGVLLHPASLLFHIMYMMQHTYKIAYVVCVYIPMQLKYIVCAKIS